MRLPSIVTSVLYVGFVAWSLYGAVVPIETYVFRMVHMGFIFALSLLVFPLSKKAGSWTRWLDVGLAILGAATIVYASWDLDKFIRRSTLPDPADFIMGVIAILLYTSGYLGGHFHVPIWSSLPPIPPSPSGPWPGDGES